MDNDFFKRDTSVAKISDSGEIIYEDPPAANVKNDLKETILENAKGPKRVEGDAGSVEQHSLRDQIEAERFLQSKKATQGKGFPIRFHKIKPGGTT